eukprot:CAMPEP_0181190894 /NCGR_PEP_ID=MMETSP1096-20121128/12436_1 /TAXON_ID=156174 ORGANISM="Chrysochromulina ericina, Strain CCMP281" /NCGR_SAMPLE_ID=MMETSP1096 /ASSEMBLY_ACC=CAM_ASM_000453 /LENGTH=112 /DNA_ID=CAMNT_0023280139 /DNA_START=66 /DNA_END=405 /DNA_ORIENTATION=-
MWSARDQHVISSDQHMVSTWSAREAVAGAVQARISSLPQKWVCGGSLLDGPLNAAHFADLALIMDWWVWGPASRLAQAGARGAAEALVVSVGGEACAVRGCWMRLCSRTTTR